MKPLEICVRFLGSDFSYVRITLLDDLGCVDVEYLEPDPNAYLGLRVVKSEFIDLQDAPELSEIYDGVAWGWSALLALIEPAVGDLQ